jgi:hypothetical protein
MHCKHLRKVELFIFCSVVLLQILVATLEEKMSRREEGKLGRERKKVEK